MSEPQSRGTRQAVQQVERFEQALRGAYDDPWWRQLVTTIKDRKQEFLEQLAMGLSDQRTEDRIRGQITELNFLLALDKYGETHPLAKETSNGRA